MKKLYSLMILFLLAGTIANAQHGKQKKADRLFEDLAYYEATDVYKELIEKDYNTTKNKLKLGDTYMKLRSPENAVHYYGDVIEDPSVSPEYYYKYAQALRGVKRYDESREWLQKYLESGGEIAAAENMLKKKEYGVKAEYRIEESDFNSEVSDFGVYEKGDKIYFVSARAEGVPENKKIYAWTGEPYLDVYVYDRNSGNVTALPGEVNTKLHDGPITISADGKTMYFNRNNYYHNREGKRDKNATNHLKIYKASLNGISWEDVEELPINNNEYSVGHPALSPDDKYLYFTSDMPGGKGGTDLYRVEILENNTYGEPENLTQVNTEGDEAFPFVDTDGTLYFSSNGLAGLGLYDIYKIDLKDASAEPQNLGEPVNSNLDDFAYFKSAENNQGYISSNRNNGNDNIFGFNQLEPLVLSGKVTDAVNHKPISQATVRLFDEDNKQIAFLETDAEGNYQTQVSRNKNLPVEAKQIEYNTYTGSVNTTDMDDKEKMTYNIELEPVKDVEYLAEIDNIYFDFDKYTIRPDAAKELDKLVELMKNEYPGLVIEISSHTDFRGSDQYNEKLAEKRAKATYDYLISNGIDESRIETYKGYGESQPAIDCDRCTKEEHQLNRRSMFKVIRME